MTDTAKVEHNLALKGKDLIMLKTIEILFVIIFQSWD